MSATSRQTCAATSRMMRSASVLAICSPLSSRPTEARSIHSLPSGLTITSMTAGSASAAAIVAPNAVRNICRRRPCASSAAGIEKRSAMGLVLLVCHKIAAVEGAFGTARRHGGGKEIRLFQRCCLKHFRGVPTALGNTSPHLRNENLKAISAHEPCRFLLGLGYGRHDRQEVAHEQSQGLRGDGLLARLARRRLAELIEATCQPLLQSLLLLWVERGSERLLDQRRLGAVAVLGYRLEFAGERV